MGRLAGYGGSVYVASLLLEDCEDAWVNGTHGTASLETTLVKVGSGSAKCEMSSVVDGDYVMYEAISSTNLTGYSTIMCWAYATAGVAAGDLKIVLDSASGLPSSPETEVILPALTATTWKFCQCTEVTGKEIADSAAAICIGLEMHANAQNITVYLDEIRAAKVVAGIKSWTLDYVKEVQETTSFSDSGHKTFIPTLDTWSGSFEGYKDGAPLTIGSIVGLELQESSTATQQWRGSAILTAIHPAASVDGLITYSYDFQGTHALELATA